MHIITRTPEKRTMLTEGNDHVGRLVWTFSLPAFSTCPGASLACLSACYALNFLFTVKPTLDLHRANWERALEPDAFARDMRNEIRGRYVRVLRIHVAGDFFSPAYVGAWIKVARSCRGVTFLFYTRSWRAPELVPDLVELASLPNVYGWWSEDRDTGPSRMPVGRRCYLCIDEADEGSVPSGVDLVFRDDTRRPLKWVGSIWICPKEQGIANHITCSSCRRCFLPGPMPLRDK